MPRHSVSFCERKDFNSTGLSTSYQVINADGFEHQVSILRIVNNCGKDVDISFDGTEDNDFIPKDGGVLQLDLQSNALNMVGTCNIPIGQKVYVKSTGASTGKIYLIGYGQGV